MWFVYTYKSLKSVRNVILLIAVRVITEHGVIKYRNLLKMLRNVNFGKIKEAQSHLKFIKIAIIGYI